jgi:hypothetical protein
MAGRLRLAILEDAVSAVMQQCRCAHHIQAIIGTAAQLKPTIIPSVRNSNSTAHIGTNATWVSAKQGEVQQQVGTATVGEHASHFWVPVLVS